MKANYFPIDRDDYTSIKSSDIIMNYGYEGYGIYFTMLQKLASTEARSIELSKIKILAYNMRVEEKLLNDIIHQYFDIKGDVFLSKSLNCSLGYYDAKYEKNSEGGKKAAANMTPEQRQERARKAAEARYNKSDDTNNTMLSTKQDMLSDLDVDANNRIEKNRIERKEEKERDKKMDFGVCVPSASSSPSETPQTTHTPNVEERKVTIEDDKTNNNTPMVTNNNSTKNNIENKNDNPMETTTQTPSTFTEFKNNLPIEIKNMLYDTSKLKYTQIGIKRNNVIDAYLQFAYEYKPIDLTQYEEVLYYAYSKFGFNYEDANYKLLYNVPNDVQNEIPIIIMKIIERDENEIMAYRKYRKNNLKANENK